MDLSLMKSQQKLNLFLQHLQSQIVREGRRKMTLEGEKELRQMWCNKHFVVSKLDGHSSVVCSLNCNQDLLLVAIVIEIFYLYGTDLFYKTYQIKETLLSKINQKIACPERSTIRFKICMGFRDLKYIFIYGL